MKNNKQLALGIAALTAVTLLGGTSAFAETRPSRETIKRDEQRSTIRRERARETRRGDSSTNRSGRGDDRRRVEVNRGRDNDRGRGGDRDRNRGSYRNDDRRSHGHRQPHYAHGRVSRVNRHGDGYRVWVSGARYPFYIPAARYHRDRFRVGLSIRLGGYYNPLGYYDYYDGGYSRGDLRGVVESVDYRRDTFVIRNDATGSFVTVVSRDWRDQVRAGDYVELSGDWSRAGIFQARDVDVIDYRR